MIALFFQTKVIDSIVYGSEHGQMFLIFRIKTKEITERIFTDIDRGSNDFKGCRRLYDEGTGEVLLCAARKSEFGQIKRIVREVIRMLFLLSVK